MINKELEKIGFKESRTRVRQWDGIKETLYRRGDEVIIYSEE